MEVMTLIQQVFVDLNLDYRIKNRSLILELKPQLYQAAPVVRVTSDRSALSIYVVQRFQCCTDGSWQGAREELVPQVISVPYDPSCV